MSGIRGFSRSREICLVLKTGKGFLTSSIEGQNYISIYIELDAFASLGD